MHWEIERRFLLDRVPPLPESARVLVIDQGYLSSQVPVERDAAAPHFGAGRLRRTKMPDGSIVHTHTIKLGAGERRSEIEREITRAEFELHWPKTQTRRLRKTRYQVHDGTLTWEIDVFDQPSLVLVEVELSSTNTFVKIPAWLEPIIVREVTDDPAFTNANIAARLRTFSRG